MIEVYRKKDKYVLNSGEIIFENKDSFKLHTDDKLFDKNTYSFKKNTYSLLQYNIVKCYILLFLL